MKDPDNPDKRNNINWMRDEVTPDLVQYHRVKKVLYSGETDFQSVEILDLYNYGVCLVLDGKIQSGEKDEFVYHEALVQPVMLSHSSPESVFIAGGGEGATLREVLNNRSVKRAVMVDLDEQVVDLCRRFLPTFHQSSFNDSRATIKFADARGYLEHTKEKYDIAIIDIVDPLEAGPACLLYTKEYYQIIKEHLNPGGAMVIQSGSCGWTNLHIFTSIVTTLKSVYKIVQPYCVYVPSFVDLWGFTIASDGLNAANLSAGDIKKLISARLNKKLKSYDGLSHQSMFVLPKPLRRKLAASRRIVTDADPVFIAGH
jgi:spermidine synthase